MKPELDIAHVVGRGPVIPVIVLDAVQNAVPLARALAAGGITVMEITLRTDAALEGIRAIRKEAPNTLIGAGSVCSEEDARHAADAGAQFLVSPGLTEHIATQCMALGLPLLPGVATAGEALRARELGHSVLKFFPSVLCGGTEMLQAWEGPLRGVQFCPTGGITPHNANAFLALKNVACVGGTWLSPPAAMARGDWQMISRLAKEAASIKPHST